MRIDSMTPIHAGSDEVARRQARYDELTNGLGLEVVLHDLPADTGAPTSFDTATNISASDDHVVEAARWLAASGARVLMPDCILDPGLGEIVSDAASSSSGPSDAFGILKLCLGLLSGLGFTYGAVARNAPIADALDAQIRRYDPSDRYLGTTVLGLSVEDVAAPAKWNQAIVSCAEAFAERGARAVINGCSAVAVEADTAIPVLDPTRVALTMLHVAETFDLTRSEPQED